MHLLPICWSRLGFSKKTRTRLRLPMRHAACSPVVPLPRRTGGLTSGRELNSVAKGPEIKGAGAMTYNGPNQRNQKVKRSICFGQVSEGNDCKKLRCTIGGQSRHLPPRTLHHSEGSTPAELTSYSALQWQERSQVACPSLWFPMLLTRAVDRSV